MSAGNSTTHTLTTDDIEGGPKGWSGVLRYPDNSAGDFTFKLSSNNKMYSSAPFRELGEHKDYVVHAWLNSCRPITLICPFCNSKGAGESAVGYRTAARISGRASAVIENEHFDAENPKAVSEVGFGSDTLALFAQFHEDKSNLTTLPDYYKGYSLLSSKLKIEGLGNLEFYIDCQHNYELDLIEVKHAFTRLKCPDGISLWTAENWARFHLALIDFLGGRAAGDFQIGLRGKREQDAVFRIQSTPRAKEDFRYNISFQHPNAIHTFLALAARAWANEDIKKRIFAATTLLNAKMGVIERFLRTVFFIEAWLRERYQGLAPVAEQKAYRDGVKAFNEFIKTAPGEVQEFSGQFARPRYPTGLSLRQLFKLAIDECAPLGLDASIATEIDLVELRNSLSHGSEFSAPDWLHKICIASDIGLAMIELLTAKDLGLQPPTNFKPRHDRLGSQNGIYTTTN